MVILRMLEDLTSRSGYTVWNSEGLVRTTAWQQWPHNSQLISVSPYVAAVGTAGSLLGSNKKDRQHHAAFKEICNGVGTRMVCTWGCVWNGYKSPGNETVLPVLSLPAPETRNSLVSTVQGQEIYSQTGVKLQASKRTLSGPVFGLWRHIRRDEVVLWKVIKFWRTTLFGECCYGRKLRTISPNELYQVATLVNCIQEVVWIQSGTQTIRCFAHYLQVSVIEVQQSGRDFSFHIFWCLSLAVVLPWTNGRTDGRKNK
jgi:hypothetical protein